MSDLIEGSLDPIFKPRSVAVIGASRRKNSIGYSLVHNLVQNEFAGTIFPVNPTTDVIHSLRCYPSVAEIPDPVDLAVVVVPRDAVPAVVDDCLAAGIKGLVVISAGFGEVDDEGREMENAIRDKVREAGARMVGPNCMGVLNADPDVRLNATFAPTPAKPGTVGFVTQSGALGVAILNVAAGLGIGFTQFASMGNKADVSGNDLLEYWESDENTKVIAMYLESFGNPKRFAQIAKRVSHEKPILIVKSGRTEEGARAASSHTGALAAADVTVSAFLDQCGVIRANTIEELFDIAQALDRCPLPKGNRVAILTNAGGPAIMATDAFVGLGLQMASFSEETVQSLRSFLPAEASVANPVDMIAAANVDEYAKATKHLLEDPGVDIVLAIHVAPLTSTPLEILHAIGNSATGRPDKPVAVVMMASEDSYGDVRTQAESIAIYRFPESAATAMARLHEYSQWRDRPSTPAPEFDVDDDAVRTLIDATCEGYMDVESAFSVLEAYGIPVVERRIVGSESEALRAAEEMGYPLVLKAVGPELVHKSDVGAVAVDLRSMEEFYRAFTDMEKRIQAAGVRAESFLLQRMVRKGHEVIYGLSVDQKLGTTLMFGLGGKYVEVFGDVRFAVPPLSKEEALEIVEGLRGHRLLEGVRGEAPTDREFLAEVLLRLAQLSERHPRIAELDINPFLATSSRAEALAVDVRIRVEPVR